MKKVLTSVLFLVVMFLIIGICQWSYTDSAYASTWHKYSSNIFGVAKRQRILKYAGANWGQYDDYDQKVYFKDNKATQYKYSRKTRVMLIRYVNKSKRLMSEYNYRKLIFTHGYKEPIIKYYYKLGQEKYSYLYTVKFWMIHPIRF
ncbi:hypothetical protein [Lentilactobacillus diolivorans]|uniref:Uncharacterized protein n=1 Tax=Lentilactobacillus diolivorans TaxID=179838 RepID=A0ABQ0XC29_9LACO|nr:hypothetical protein [Lentilactobacillus diolivorans]GEP23597.1 hypothetical protein LDI01_11900 [Lentilactobacillus diolivorans]